MAFGKANIKTAGISGWRQRSAARDEDKQRLRGGGNKRGGMRISDVFWLPEETPARIRVIPGEYKLTKAIELDKGKWGTTTEKCEYFEGVEHKDWTNHRSCMCSAGPLYFDEKYAQPCIGCLVYKSAPWVNNKRESRISRSDLWVFSIYHFGLFAQIDVTDRAGIPKVSERTGETYKKWVPFTSIDPDAQEIYQEKEGHMMHFPMGAKYKDELIETDQAISNSCLSCRTQDSIYRTQLCCASCGASVIDCQKTAVPLKTQEDYLSSMPVTCPACGTVDLLSEKIACRICAAPKRATLFHTDIEIIRHDKALRVLSMSAPYLLDASIKAKPLDLVSMYQPDPINIQEERFGISLLDARMAYEKSKTQ